MQIEIYDTTGNNILTTEPDDSSVLSQELMGDDTITLEFSLSYWLDIPIGSYCNYGGVRYSLETPAEVRLINRYNWKYTLNLEAPSGRLKYIILKDVNGGRTAFSISGDISDHIGYVVSNANARETGTPWTYNCYANGADTITYDNVTVRDALDMIADKFNTEWRIVNKNIIVGKLDIDASVYLPLSYGKGNGVKSGVVRKSANNEPFTRMVYPVTSDRNIYASNYPQQSNAHSRTLLLPNFIAGIDGDIGYDGEYFNWEQGYDSTSAKHFLISDDRRSVYLAREGVITIDFNVYAGEREDSLDCTEIYPKRVGEVDDIVTTTGADNTTIYYFTDADETTLPDYSQLKPAGSSKLTVVFQDGNLAGREFEVDYLPSGIPNKVPAKSFRIYSKEEDGYDMPSGTFVPAQGDKYIVFGSELPQEYIANKTTHTGAEWELAKKVIKYLYDRSEVEYAIDIEIDGIWSRLNWSRLSLNSYFRIGAYIQYSDADMFPNGILLRVIRLRKKLNYPYSPEIELSHIRSRYGLRKRTLLKEANLQAALAGTVWTTNRIESQINRLDYQQQNISAAVTTIQQQVNQGGSNT